MTAQDEYFAELEAIEEKKERDSYARMVNDSYAFGGGYEASHGDYEGACLARAEFEGGAFS